MRNLFLIAGMLFLTISAWAHGVQYPKNLLVANGGQFGDTTQNVVVQSLQLHTLNMAYADTINTQSIQDLIVVGDYAYLAAQDSIYKIDVRTMDILNSANFPGPSTVKLFYNDSVLWVGNWYGSPTHNLYAFDSDDLSFKFSVPEITKGVTSMALLNDTLILTQNQTSSTWSDSAGYAALVDASTGSFIQNVPLDNVSDAGWVFVIDNEVVFVNPGSNTYGYFNNVGNYVLNPFGADLSGGNGPKVQLLDETLLGIFDGSLGAYDLVGDSFLISGLIDTVNFFVFDTIESIIYTTASDFVNYTVGAAYDTTGQKLFNFDVGFSPEAMALYYVYNEAPITNDFNDTTTVNVDKTLDVFASDPDRDPLVTTIIEQASNGIASVNTRQDIDYTPNMDFTGIDSVSFQVCDSGLPIYAQACDSAKVYIWVDGSVGVAMIDLENTFELYPNPAVNKTTISVEDADEYNIRVIAMDGKVVSIQNQVYISDRFELSVQNLSTGAYFVLLENEGKVQMQKLIKR